MMRLNFACLIFTVLIYGAVNCDDALKNHRLEKRQDDSFLFFGGWRPVGSRSSFYQGSSSGRYHDILSALPTSFDSSSRYYTHALPSTYHKDIYSYYPRPAIRSPPKKNTPIYMERLRPQKPKQNYGGRGLSNFAPQIIDFPQIDLKQIQELKAVLEQAKNIPYQHLNIPFDGRKPVEIVEVAVQPLPLQGGQSYSKKSNKGHNRNRNSQRGKKIGYMQIPQPRIPFHSPMQQYQYFSYPKSNPIIQQIIPKEVAVAPLKLAPILPSVEDLLGLKNVQVVEVPVPANLYGGGQSYNEGHSSQVTNLPKTYSYATSSQSSEISYPEISTNTYQKKQPSKYQGSSKSKSNHAGVENVVEAELIKLNEEDLQGLLSNLHILDKAPDDLLKYLPIGDLDKIKEAIQVVLSEQGDSHGSDQSSAYQPQNSQPQTLSYDSSTQYSNSPGYSQKESSYKLDSAGYQVEEQSGNQVEHNAAGYQVENAQNSAGYYQQTHYQSTDGRSSYEQQASYERNGHQEQANSYPAPDQDYAKDNENTGNQQSAYKQGEQSYIQVIAPPDKNGFRREPVLAVEIQHGQTVEEAIKSLDPDTLKKLGAHGENGLEIEVVEVPIDEYASESKKSETVVPPAKNSTIIFKKRVLKEKS